MTTMDDLYQQVVTFYGRHYELIDTGAVRECAQTFTAEATMIRNGSAERMRRAAAVRQGRTRIAEALSQVTLGRAAAGITRRHLVGQLTVARHSPGFLATRYCLLVIDTPRARPPVIASSAVVRDLLLQRDGQLLMHQRRIDHDDARHERGGGYR
jgi:hypothetical protein